MTAAYTETVFHRKRDYSILAVPASLAQSDTMPMGYSETIAILRKQLGLTQGQLAERLNVEQPTVQRWESGAREPSLTKLSEIAKALGVDAGALLDEGFLPAGPRLFIKGEVAAGNWVEAYEWPDQDWREFMGRPDMEADTVHRFGLRVVGNSMSEVYPHGTIVECLSIFAMEELVPGKRVVILRTRDDMRHEATVKELAADSEGRLWGVPKSHDPTFTPISLSEPDPGITEVRVIAVVVASYRLE